jgi:sensor histidine kinase YesM
LATVLGVLSVAILHFGRLAAGQPAPLLSRLTTLIDWWTWAIFAPVVIWLAQRLPIRGERRGSGVAFHLAVGTVVGLIELVVFTVVAGWYNHSVLGSTVWPFGQRYLLVLSLWFPYALLIYWIIVIAVHAVEYQRRYRERQLAEAELRGQLVGAQLQALRMQLHPHFLFNSLNTVAVFMREGRTEEAIEMQTRLAAFLRQTLEHEGRETVTLREELDFVEGYLEIEEIRFGDRLTIEIAAEPDALDALVPFMLLQPLVENSMRHGMAGKIGRGRIEISARRAGGRLAIDVADDGPGFSPSTAAGERSGGLGLSNTRARLERMYGTDHSFEVADRSGGGARVTLSIPFAARPAELAAQG